MVMRIAPVVLRPIALLRAGRVTMADAERNVVDLFVWHVDVAVYPRSKWVG